MAVTRKRAAPLASSKKAAQVPAAPVELARAPRAAADAALELAGGDWRRLRAALEPDGRVSVTVVNRVR
jgi:uncharacterized lipoprotein YbaY